MFKKNLNTVNEKTLKVLFITLEYGNRIGGGAGRVINGVVDRLAKKIKTDVFHLLWNKGLMRWQIRIYFEKKNKTILKKYFFANYLAVLRQCLRDGNYNIVHIIHNSHEMAECINFIKEHFPLIKIIYSCHSMAKYESYIRYASPAHLKSEFYILNNINHLHLLNNTSLSYLEISYPGLSSVQKISIIPNGVNEHDFINQNSRWKKKIGAKLKVDELVIVCMSRWSHGKGLEYLINAVCLLITHTRKFKIIIAGRKKHSWENGVDQYVSMINAGTASLQDYIIVLDWLDNAKRNALLSIADIWIMPSLLEYFPYSILEPMINKIPIISARINSVTELLNDNEDCLFYEPADAAELAEKIIYLIENQTIRERLALHSYNKAKRLFQWENIVSLYLDMYHKVINKN